MTYDILKKEVIGLSDDRLAQVIDFIRFLKSSNTQTSATPSISFVYEANDGNQSAKRSIGFMADDFVSISSDFDTCLEGMEEYV